jgi:hypothetical protein
MPGSRICMPFILRGCVVPASPGTSRSEGSRASNMPSAFNEGEYRQFSGISLKNCLVALRSVDSEPGIRWLRRPLYSFACGITLLEYSIFMCSDYHEI